MHLLAMACCFQNFEVMVFCGGFHFIAMAWEMRSTVCTMHTLHKSIERLILICDFFFPRTGKMCVSWVQSAHSMHLELQMQTTFILNDVVAPAFHLAHSHIHT